MALVTGAARGMGAAIATLFVAEGARVVLADILAGEVAETARTLAGKEPGSAEAVTLDVTDADAWQRAVDLAVSRFGGLHILVNNAGVSPPGGSPIESTSTADWERILAVNLSGPFLGMRAALPAIRESVTSGGRGADAAGVPASTGAIVNISSAQAFRPSPGLSPYSASKWGLRGLTKVAALEAAPHVRVNSVHPGPVDTAMTADADPAMRAAMVGMLPLGRIGRPEDVASLVLFLASDESGFSTGSEFIVDGGRLIAG